MKKISEYLFLCGTGGGIYYSLEVLFRGFSHWSMFVLGGICMMFFAYQGQVVHWRDPFFRQVLRCSIFVTAMEFITGMIVNKWLAMHVWDYSRMPLQLFGQICVPFALLFAGLSAVGIYLSAMILCLLYHEEMPAFVRKSILSNSGYKCYNSLGKYQIQSTQKERF